jgi:CTP synthase (UTP-ammonia lyase)
VLALRRDPHRHPHRGHAPGADLRHPPFDGYHYCGYGLSDEGARALQAAGVTIAATAPDAGVEAIELPDHPFFLATAFQPQVGVGASGRLPALLAAFAH